MRKIIPGFERYEADSDGFVVNRKTGRILKGAKQRNGYIHVELQTGSGPKQMLMHRVIAMAFVDNPDNLPLVNHKDENRGNNRADNLEWCTASYNQNYGTCKARQKSALESFHKSSRLKEIARKNGAQKARPVEQISKGGKVVARYESAAAAGRALAINKSHISECCIGHKRKTAGGYIWKYERSDDLSAFQ